MKTHAYMHACIYCIHMYTQHSPTHEHTHIYINIYINTYIYNYLYTHTLSVLTCSPKSSQRSPSLQRCRYESIPKPSRDFTYVCIYKMSEYRAVVSFCICNYMEAGRCERAVIRESVCGGVWGRNESIPKPSRDFTCEYKYLYELVVYYRCERSFGDGE